MNEPHLASAEFGGFGIRFLAPVRDTVVEQQICRSRAAAGRLPAQQ